MVSVLIRIEGSNLPGTSCGPSPDAPGGYHNIHVGVQRKKPRDQLLGLVSGGAPSATWSVPCDVVRTPSGLDWKGPFIQGPLGGRFLYLSWGEVDDAGTFTMFRRAKLRLDEVPAAVVDAAIDLGVLVARLGLTDPKGHPLCASVRPPQIEWSAAAG